jgi:adenylosuccinate synthase
MTIRKNSIAIGGGAFGDEGKGRLVDKFVSDYSKKGKVVVYRDNGGANAGHTVEFDNGNRVALHQLPSGVFIKDAYIVLGKNMVLHPGDLLEEIKEVEKVNNNKQSNIMIDTMALLSLDIHRAYETVLKTWMDGGKGSTGRGIGPAYADLVYRNALRVRDLVLFDESKIKAHYSLYKALCLGLGFDLAGVEVAALNKDSKIPVGSETEFVEKLKQQSKELEKYYKDVFSFMEESWNDTSFYFVFEKAQGVGLDTRWGVYPDVTASDTTFSGIFSSTEGIVDPSEIEFRVSVIKATYMSSVGVRILPSMMEETLANKIREDAHEYGATTKRPRGIAYIDIPALRYFNKVGKANYLALTHMDIVYPNTPIKICTGYTINGKEVSYRPDQEYLNTVTPVFDELGTWSADEVSKARTKDELPENALKYISFLEREIGVPVMAITTGPKREQGMFL